MSTYVITGVSRGIGFELLKQISDDPENLVVGLVRDKPATEAKIAAELGNRPNVTVLYGDVTKYASLEKAAADTAPIVGNRGVDYLIANAAYQPNFDYTSLRSMADHVEELDTISRELFDTNVIGNIHLFHLFLPLVIKSKVKKVITLSTGLADIDLTNQYDVKLGPLYAASKAAMNVIVAKFNAEYKKDGVLFLSLSPGVVDVGRGETLTPEQAQSLQEFAGRITLYAPDFKGPFTPAEAVPGIRSIWEKASIEEGFGGAFISHFGNKQWV